MLPKLLNDSHQVLVGVLLQTGVRTALACTVFSSGGQIETHINKQHVLLSGVNTSGQRRCGVGRQTDLVEEHDPVQLRVKMNCY